MAATGLKRVEGLQSPGVPLGFFQPLDIDIPSRVEVPVTYQPTDTFKRLRRTQRPIDVPTVPARLRSVFLRRRLKHNASFLAFHLYAGPEGVVADTKHLAVRLGFQRTTKSAGL